MIHIIQPDHGDIHRSKPYPFFADESGAVQRQDFWRGRVATVIGFVSELSRQEIDLPWPEALAQPERVIGMHVVTADSQGAFSTHEAPVAKFEVSE